VEPQKTLPSFLFLDDTQPSASTPATRRVDSDKLVHSAKSWLSNPDVDRNAKILPWIRRRARVLSPVEVSARFLTKIREAWEARRRARTEHDIVLTVPASFDEEARELTVAAPNRPAFPS